MSSILFPIQALIFYLNSTACCPYLTSPPQTSRVATLIPGSSYCVEFNMFFLCLWVSSEFSGVLLFKKKQHVSREKKVNFITQNKADKMNEIRWRSQIQKRKQNRKAKRKEKKNKMSIIIRTLIVLVLMGTAKRIRVRSFDSRGCIRVPATA